VYYDARPAPPATWSERWSQLVVDVGSRFTGWMLASYQGLFNQPALKPVMVHHVPRFLARIQEQSGRKVALLVVDGLSFAQWTVLRDAVLKQRPGLRFREDGVFAWVPT